MLSSEIPIPVITTFAHLAASEEPRVGGVIVAALDVPREAIQLAAAEALASRSGTMEHLELFNRLERLPNSVRELVKRSTPPLDRSLRQCLLKGELPTRLIALKTIRLTEQFSQISALIDLLMRPSFADRGQVAETLRALTNRLYDRWQSSHGQPGDQALVNGLRSRMLSELDRGIAECDALGCAEEVVEAILVLGDCGHPAVKRVLWQAAPLYRDLATRAILDSRHPGVLRLIAASLSENYPHPKIFEAIKYRQDPEFISAMLRGVHRRRTARQLQHLHQVDHLSWVEPPFELLATIPPALQPALVVFINATGISRELKAGVQEWLLRFGTPDGRLAATNNVTLLDETVIQDVVRESLTSDDIAVQAWATSQLRQHAIPEAFSLLVERLDSPVTSVREAARNELSGFNVERVLALADELSLEEAHRAGQLVMKVDLEAAAKLRRELAHPSRRRRIGAAHSIARLGLHPQFTTAFIAMTEDLDPHVRRAGAEVLSRIGTVECLRVLERLANDAHPRVRETAQALLHRTNEGPSESTLQASDPTW